MESIPRYEADGQDGMRQCSDGRYILIEDLPDWAVRILHRRDHLDSELITELVAAITRLKGDYAVLRLAVLNFFDLTEAAWEPYDQRYKAREDLYSILKGNE